ncbi:PEP-CTERM sorting domain-containing protein [Novosphingobium fuchskuhlense]|uniref:PEP-CTERM sorting domain-containing protein n=1 Tax=Novosphingobium fuchskuhlense TaxID=1117702 RepID=UPI000A46609D|nr:PEP-CTERM sorting domain-containing protein [Novosphingobium fuchskuhlense]
MFRFLPIAIVALATTAGTALAQASGGTAIPEPTDGALFAIGLAGLIIGRRVARRKDD